MQSNAKQSRAKKSKANTERGQVKEKPPNWGRAGFILLRVTDSGGGTYRQLRIGVFDLDIVTMPIL